MSLQRLAGAQFEKYLFKEFFWEFHFSNGICTVEYPSRLLNDKGIFISSKDHLQRYGHPEPINASVAINEILKGLRVKDVELSKKTLDLKIVFEKELVLELLRISTDYESWQINFSDGSSYLVSGYGELVSFPPRPSTSSGNG